MLPLHRLENLTDLIIEFFQSKGTPIEIGARYCKFEPHFPGVGPCYRSGLSIDNPVKCFNLEFTMPESNDSLIVYENLDGDLNKVFLKSILCVVDLSEGISNSEILNLLIVELVEKTFDMLRLSAIQYQEKVQRYENLRCILNA